MSDPFGWISDFAKASDSQEACLLNCRVVVASPRSDVSDEVPSTSPAPEMLDPFGWISDLAKPSDSQETLLRNCRFVGASSQHDVSGEYCDEVPIASTGIFMQSLPVEEEEHRTPEEHLLEEQSNNLHEHQAVVNDDAVDVMFSFEAEYESCKGFSGAIVGEHDNDVVDVASGEIGEVSSKGKSPMLNDIALLDSERATSSKAVMVENEIGNNSTLRSNTTEGRSPTFHPMTSVEAEKRVEDGIQNLLDFLLTSSGNDGENDVDILETAKSTGWQFPRPRWWRREGY